LRSFALLADDANVVLFASIVRSLGKLFEKIIAHVGGNARFVRLYLGNTLSPIINETKPSCKSLRFPEDVDFPAGAFRVNVDCSCRLAIIPDTSNPESEPFASFFTRVFVSQVDGASQLDFQVRTVHLRSRPGAS